MAAAEIHIYCLNCSLVIKFYMLFMVLVVFAIFTSYKTLYLVVHGLPIGVYRYISVYFGVFRYISAYFGIFRCISVYFGVFRSVYFGVFRYISVYFGVKRDPMSKTFTLVSSFSTILFLRRSKDSVSN